MSKPAFPIPEHRNNAGKVLSPRVEGMSLREYAAIHIFAANYADPDMSPSEAVVAADFLMSELGE